jgi:hypothetical protein
LKPARQLAKPGLAALRASSRHWKAATSACSMHIGSPLHVLGDLEERNAFHTRNSSCGLPLALAEA